MKAIIKVDILLVTETKSYSTFPISQSYINGFAKPSRFDRNRNGRGVLIYTGKDIPSKELDNYLPNDIEGMLIELNLRKSKWFLFGCYDPSSTILTMLRTIWIN